MVNIVHDLTDRGVGFKVLTGQVLLSIPLPPQVSGSLAFFAALAEFECELISERTKPGLASARGRKGG